MVKSRLGVRSFDRTCLHCKETFDTKRGLQLHQKNKIRPGCYRAGVSRKLTGVRAARTLHFDKCKGRVLPKTHVSLASKRRRGQNLTAGEKAIYLNVYDYFCKNSSSNREVNHESKMAKYQRFWSN